MYNSVPENHKGTCSVSCYRGCGQTDKRVTQTNKHCFASGQNTSHSPRQPARSGFLTNAVPFTPVPCGFGVVCILDDAWVCMHPSLPILSTFSTPQFSQHRAHTRYYFYFCPLVSSPLLHLADALTLGDLPRTPPDQV